MGIEPGGQRLRIEAGGVGGLPGRVERDLEGGQVEVEHGGDAVGGAVGVRGGDEPGVGVALAVAQLDTLPRRVGREGGHAQLGRQVGQVVLRGPDPLAAAVDGEAARGAVGEGTAAHPVARLEHEDVDAVAVQLAGGGQAGEAGADHHHLALPLLGPPWPWTFFRSPLLVALAIGSGSPPDRAPVPHPGNALRRPGQALSSPRATSLVAPGNLRRSGQP